MLAHPRVTNAVQNITVILDQQRDGLKKEFRCVACGHTVFKYYGGVTLIVPGSIDTEISELDWSKFDGKPIELECKNSRHVEVDDDYGELKQRVQVKCKTRYSVIG